MNVTELRDLARRTLADCGARGFVRFVPEGRALLATDAAQRCADGGAALVAALERAGFSCTAQGGLVLLTPGDALLMRLCAREGGEASVDWSSPLHPVQALAARLLRAPAAPLSDGGRALVIEAARLLWHPAPQVLSGMASLRARAAALLWQGDTSGFAPAGALLANWYGEQAREEIRT